MRGPRLRLRRLDHGQLPKQLVGTGVGYDNNWAPITLGPDGTACIGVFNGLAAVRDGA